MSSDRTIGGVILLGSIVGIFVYFWLVFVSPWGLMTLRVSAFLVVAALLGVVAWIGYTLATTPAPVPLEDLDLGAEFESGSGESGEESVD